MKASAALLPLAIAGCVHRGAGWEAPPPAPSGAPAVSLLLIGEVTPGKTIRRVARELDAALDAEKRAGRTPVVLWLGNNVFPAGPVAGDGDAECVGVERAWSQRGPAELAATVRTQGTPSFAALGHREWRCGHPELELQATAEEGPHPWAMPDHNYVVRVGTDGSTRVVSACGAAGEAQCGIEPGAKEGGALVDLVVLDTVPWVIPPEAGTAADTRAQASLAQQAALLEGLSRMDPATAPPRILVSHVPVETAGIHGQGGLSPTATFRQFPPPLRDALRDGVFIGVVSAHDRSLQATADLSDAVKRSAKTWLVAPVFQVVSGASARPDGHAPFTARQLRGFQGMSLVPDLYSTHPGFARVVLGPERVDVILHARHGGRWTTGGVSFDLHRPPHPPESASPSTAPCLRCDPARGAADADRWSAAPE